MDRKYGDMKVVPALPVPSKDATSKKEKHQEKNLETDYDNANQKMSGMSRKSPIHDFSHGILSLLAGPKARAETDRLIRADAYMRQHPDFVKETPEDYDEGGSPNNESSTGSETPSTFLGDEQVDLPVGDATLLDAPAAASALPTAATSETETRSTSTLAYIPTLLVNTTATLSLLDATPAYLADSPALAVLHEHARWVDTLWSMFLLLALVASIFNCCWDLIMDWGFLESGPAFPFREHSTFPSHSRKWYFTIAVGLNIMLRFVWIESLLPSSMGVTMFKSDLTVLYISLLEVFRRSVWNVIRLDYEHIVKQKAVPQLVYDDDE